MTARETLDEYVDEARRFRYRVDSDSPDPLVQAFSDIWDTSREVEERGAADCDGLSLRTIDRAHDATVHDHGISGNSIGTRYAVAGLVRQRGRWVGHMWVALEDGGQTWWADPTWHLRCGSPAALGYPDTRFPVARWTHQGGGLFDDQQDYLGAPVLPVATDATLAAGFLSPLVVRHDLAARGTPDEWVLIEPLIFRSTFAADILVPAGFRTDFCSVPRAPFAYLLTGGTGHEAGVVHDYIYKTGCLPRDVGDPVLAEALTALGEPWWRVSLMYHGVQVFGAPHYKGAA